MTSGTRISRGSNRAISAGRPVLSVDSLVLRPAVASSDVPRDALFRIRWVEVRPASGVAQGTIATVGFDTGHFPAYPDLESLVGKELPSAVVVAGVGCDSGVFTSTR